ncbi:MAG: energy transducer TonB [Pseudomonadota bacterium]
MTVSISKSFKFFTALSIAAVSSAALATEVPAAFDPKTCKASYPKASLVNEEQGLVSMLLLVAVDGNVLDSKVDRTSGFKNLDKAALKAFSACKFKPATKDGSPNQSWTKVEYEWKLG